MRATSVHLESRRSVWTRAGMAATSFMLATLVACDGALWLPAASDGTQIVLQRSDVHVLGTSEAIAAVYDLEVLSDGTVWVFNSLEPFFVGFDANGSVLQEHGRAGGGPGEFGAPSGFVVGGIAGKAWTFDRERHLMIDVSAPDVTRSEISLPRDAIPTGSLWGSNPIGGLVRTARLGDDLILPRRGQPGRETTVSGFWLSIWTADIIAMNLETRSVREVIALGRTLGDPTAHFELGGAGIPFPFWFRLWAVCSDSEIRVYDRLRNELRGFTLDGIEIEATPLPPVSLNEVTQREFARVMFDFAVVRRMGQVPRGAVGMSSADSAQILNDFLRSLNAPPAQLANLLPRYVDYRCDDEGTQWIQPFDLDTPGPLMGGLRGGRIWLRITTDGETDEIRLPDRFDPYRFTPDKIWGVQRNEFDVASVAWIAVPPVVRTNPS